MNPVRRNLDSPDPSVSEGRRGERVPVSVAATSYVGAEEWRGRLRNISLGGALFVVPELRCVAAGTGLELLFRLPSGVLIRVSSVARWSKTNDPPGQCSVGLQFSSLVEPSRSFVEQYITEMRSRGPVAEIEADATAKYKISYDIAGRLQMTLSGMLSPEEARGFCEQLEQRLERRRGSRLQFELDARNLTVCSQETMQRIRQALESIARRPNALGLFIGGSTVAQVQLLRCARECGMGDSVFVVNKPEEAAEIWNRLGD